MTRIVTLRDSRTNSREGLQSYDGLDCRVVLQAPGVEDRVHIVDVAGT